MTEKKRRTARALRDRKRLARYFHTHGYGRLAGGYARKKDETSVRLKIIFVAIALPILILGLFFIIF